MCNSYGSALGVYITIWGIATIIIASIVGSGFQVIDINEAGLVYDEVNLSIDSTTVYLPGKYWVGLGKKIISFPTSLQNITFLGSNSIKCKTSDKSDIELELRVIYKLRPEFLYEQHIAFLNRDYIAAYNNLIRSVVQNTAAKFDMVDFIYNRTEVSQVMSYDINLSMRNSMYSELVYIQMRNIIFNSNLEGFIVQNFDSKKQIIVQEILKESQKVEGRIEIIYSEADKQAKNILSLANSTAAFYANKASTEISKYDLIAKATALKPLMDSNYLNFTLSEFNKLILANILDDKTFYETQTNYTFFFSEIGD